MMKLLAEAQCPASCLRLSGTSAAKNTTRPPTRKEWAEIRSAGIPRARAVVFNTKVTVDEEHHDARTGEVTIMRAQISLFGITMHEGNHAERVSRR